MFRALKVVTVMLLSMVAWVGCNKPDEPEPVSHDYVDLGLPSGTLWATCNVGAEKPEDFGDYFAWGETVTKDVYDWKSYKYGGFILEKYDLNKYCTDSIFSHDGFVDGLTLLEASDDVATANWGADWRMPTIEDWEELFLNTTGTWTTLNGVKGWLVTSLNGNSIFLPAAGYYWDDVHNPDLGLYWSASINKEFPYRAWGFHYNCDSSHLCGSSDRNRGQTVRAVRVARDL